ncbi:MAG TPA: alpha/beta fold hydrolase [Burkholderiaceae bacterium]|nr:alpha/beta fold hydrolase [Burkholderiaceae bacterium]
MRVSVRGVGIEVDDQGPASGEPLLLIMGLGMQLIGWPDDLVQLLVSRGFRVIRFDNRDTGLSQSFDEHGVPNLVWAMLRFAMHLPVSSPYKVSDMADDAIGVLDALNLPRAHVCGASMGGMIAQHIAATHPQRVKSLTLMMTTTGARGLPQASLDVRRALIARPKGHGPEAAARHLQGILELIGSPAYRDDPARVYARVLAGVQRAYRPAGTARQLLAIAADGDRTPLLARIGAPTRVIHGEADPLIPVAAGRDLAQRIRDAQADFIAGMGHDLPSQLLPRFADGMRDNARRASH